MAAGRTAWNPPFKEPSGQCALVSWSYMSVSVCGEKLEVRQGPRAKELGPLLREGHEDSQMVPPQCRLGTETMYRASTSLKQGFQKKRSPVQILKLYSKPYDVRCRRAPLHHHRPGRRETAFCRCSRSSMTSKR